MQALVGGHTAATINLAAQILMVAALFVGYYYARKRKIRPHHANIQTTVVLLNLLFILLIMGVTFWDMVKAGEDFGRMPNTWVIIHVVLGIVAELSGIYLVLRMRTNLIPASLRIKNFKLQMQLTLALWTLVALLGLAIYGAFYFGG